MDIGVTGAFSITNRGTRLVAIRAILAALGSSAFETGADVQPDRLKAIVSRTAKALQANQVGGSVEYKSIPKQLRRSAAVKSWLNGDKDRPTKKRSAKDPLSGQPAQCPFSAVRPRFVGEQERHFPSYADIRTNVAIRLMLAQAVTDRTLRLGGNRLLSGSDLDAARRRAGPRTMSTTGGQASPNLKLRRFFKNGEPLPFSLRLHPR